MPSRNLGIRYFNIKLNNLKEYLTHSTTPIVTESICYHVGGTELENAWRISERSHPCLKRRCDELTHDYLPQTCVWLFTLMPSITNKSPPAEKDRFWMR
ncbi:hypothetical protein CEXT_346631 [Caerostris extrusa]|uniref:Uncharacterized protein n=1 Tax=Caerostris extrusa TaxID=172846 RepID=A0AAV4NYN7_CAEEX|nr:hypothetical protein CEXT_346631 [Caerostris extrusa]